MPQEYADERYFRLKRAMNLSPQYKYLPKDEQTTDAEVCTCSDLARSLSASNAVLLGAHSFTLPHDGCLIIRNAQQL